MKYGLILLVLLSACAPMSPAQTASVSLSRLSTTAPAVGSFSFTSIQNLKAQVQTGKPYASITVEYTVKYGAASYRRHVAFFYHRDKSVSEARVLTGDAASSAQLVAECTALMNLPMTPAVHI